MCVPLPCAALPKAPVSQLNTCIESSYALAGALTDLGYPDARPVRVEAASFPEDREIQHVILGSLHPRSRTRKGYWCGHLAVCIGQSWLLDPTLDQSNYVHGTQWADAGIGVEPVAAPIAPEFWNLDLPPHQRQLWVRFPAVSTRYSLAPQNSFARAGALRPSFWRPLANEITRWLEQTQLCPKRIGEILRRNPQPCGWIERGSYDSDELEGNGPLPERGTLASAT